MTESPDGLYVQYLPVNQAWLVTFGNGPEASRLAGPFNEIWEATEYVADLRRSVHDHDWVATEEGRVCTVCGFVPGITDDPRGPEEES